jgi:hypothetical protein
MLRKISITLVLLLLVGCSNLPTKDVSVTSEERLLMTKINDGKIDEAKEQLTQIGLTLEAKKLEDYQALISKRDQEVKDLEKLINILKVAFSKNQIFIIERYTDMGIKNKMKLKELEKLDLSRGNIYTSAPTFNGDQANILTVINFYDESLYLDIFFNKEKGKWKIKNFSERG